MLELPLKRMIDGSPAPEGGTDEATFLARFIRSRDRCLRPTATPATHCNDAAAELRSGIPASDDDFLRWNLHW